MEADQREKLERLARYVSRPPVSVERLDLTAQGQVRYRLKTPYHDGTTRIVLEPLDFIARLAALVPPPRVHLTRPEAHLGRVQRRKMLARRDVTPIRHRDVRAALTQWLLRATVAKQSVVQNTYPLTSRSPAVAAARELRQIEIDSR